MPRFELPEAKKLLHAMTMPIRWGDMDTMGHVNNTLYFRYLEVARIEWLRTLGLVPVPGAEGFVIVNAFCTFHKQLEYPGDIEVKMYASDVGRSSFESWGTMERVGQPGLVYASGGATTVWVNYKEQKSRPMPERVRQLLV
jgi:acyl-CoA thioester hydrolase